MAKFEGYRCDGPDCEHIVSLSDSTERKISNEWLKVEVSTGEGYNSSYTFCSYRCLVLKFDEERVSQDDEAKPIFIPKPLTDEEESRLAEDEKLPYA